MIRTIYLNSWALMNVPSLIQSKRKAIEHLYVAILLWFMFPRALEFCMLTGTVVSKSQVLQTNRNHTPEKVQ